LLRRKTIVAYPTLTRSRRFSVLSGISVLILSIFGIYHEQNTFIAMQHNRVCNAATARCCPGDLR
jgi:hypothetical protein